MRQSINFFIHSPVSTSLRFRPIQVSRLYSSPISSNKKRHMSTTTTTAKTITVCQAPSKPIISGRSIFLAGSIVEEDNWRERFVSMLKLSFSTRPPQPSPSSQSQSITILNPLRQDWDSSWVEDISDDRFREQVEWELDGQERADVIAMYMHPKTDAPITLLELGLAAANGKSVVVVCCPEGFGKRGNVQVVCKKYGIGMVESLEGLVEEVILKLSD